MGSLNWKIINVQSLVTKKNLRDILRDSILLRRIHLKSYNIDIYFTLFLVISHRPKDLSVAVRERQ